MLLPSDGRTRRPHAFLSLASLLAPALFSLLLLFGGGLMLGLLQALEPDPAAGHLRIGLHHFRKVLLDPDFTGSLGLTLYIAITSTLVAALLSIPLALLLARQSRHGRIRSFLLQLPLTVPHLVVAIATLFLLAPTGLLARAAAALRLSEPGSFPLLVNDPWAISALFVYVWKEIPFITLMLLTVLTNIGDELKEAGQTLGAGPWQRFRHVTLPTMLPSLAAAMLIVFAFTFGAFEVPYLLGETYPMTLPVWAYKQYSDVDLLARPEGIAIGLLIAVIVIGLVAASQLTMAAARRWGGQW